MCKNRSSFCHECPDTWECRDGCERGNCVAACSPSDWTGKCVDNGCNKESALSGKKSPAEQIKNPIPYWFRVVLAVVIYSVALWFAIDWLYFNVL